MKLKNDLTNIFRKFLDDIQIELESIDKCK